MTIEIKPLTIHTGAEISGVDITQPLSQGDAGEIWDAFLKWKVVVFRNQKMDHAQQVAFARTFGDLTIGHAVFGHVDGYPEVYSVAKNRWDNRYKPAPKNIRPGRVTTPILPQRTIRQPSPFCVAISFRPMAATHSGRICRSV